MCSTYNHYYTDNIQKRRKEKMDACTEKARQAATTKIRNDQGFITKTNFSADTFQKEMDKAVQRDMEVFAAEETLESSRAYYKVRESASRSSFLQLTNTRMR